MKVPERDTKSKPLFLVARSFDINKPGTEIKDLAGGVLGGTLKKGKLKVNDKIEIKPGIAIKKHDITEYKTIKTKVVEIRAGSKKLDEAFPSGSLAIQTALDPSLTKADSLAGCVVGLENELPEITYKMKIKTNLFEEIVGAKEKQIKVEPIKTNEFLLLSVNTAITIGNVLSVKKDTVELALKIPVVAFSSDRVGIARNFKGHWRLIGYGEIL